MEAVDFSDMMQDADSKKRKKDAKGHRGDLDGGKTIRTLTDSLDVPVRALILPFRLRHYLNEE